MNLLFIYTDYGFTRDGKFGWEMILAILIVIFVSFKFVYYKRKLDNANNEVGSSVIIVTIILGLIFGIGCSQIPYFWWAIGIATISPFIIDLLILNGNEEHNDKLRYKVTGYHIDDYDASIPITCLAITIGWFIIPTYHGAILPIIILHGCFAIGLTVGIIYFNSQHYLRYFPHKNN